MADFASPFPAGDPRTATFNDTIATIEHQETSKIAEDEAARKEAQTGFQQRSGEFSRTEPLSLQKEAFQANAEGLAQSSTNAQRRGTVLGDYVAKRGAARVGLEKAEGRISRSEQNARETGGLERKTAYDRAFEQFLASQVKEPQTAPIPESYQQAYAQYPAATLAVAQQFPGGINEQRAWIKANSKYVR